MTGSDNSSQNIANTRNCGLLAQLLAKPAQPVEKPKRKYQKRAKKTTNEMLDQSLGMMPAPQFVLPPQPVGMANPLSGHLPGPLVMDVNRPIANMTYLNISKEQFMHWYPKQIILEIQQVHHRCIAWKQIVRLEAEQCCSSMLLFVDFYHHRQIQPLINKLPPSYRNQVPAILLAAASNYENMLVTHNTTSLQIRAFLANSPLQNNLDFTNPSFDQFLECLKQAAARANNSMYTIQQFTILSQSFYMDFANPIHNFGRMEMLKSLTCLPGETIDHFFQTCIDALPAILESRKFFFFC